MDSTPEERYKDIEFRFSNRFDRSYNRLDYQDQEKVDEALELFRNNPEHPSLELEKIRGKEDIWSIRATRAIRITFNWEENTVALRVVGDHRVYSNP